MADKFFHEFPPTTTLKDDSILLLDQNNQTTAITLAQLKSFLGSGSSGTNYTTVGNASAGIFVAAQCYTSGSGKWTAPDGCYTARVTVVGSGCKYVWDGRPIPINGQDSTFNYNGPTITGTTKNQLIAKGGTGLKPGGGAGWNGVSVTESFVPITSGKSGAIAQGKCAANGYGGCGGSGNPYSGVYGGGIGGKSLGRNGSFAPPNIVSNTGLVGSIDSFGYGASGGIGGNSLGALGGGSPMFSSVATTNSDFASVINTCGDGGYGGAAGGWCMAIVQVTPKASYTYKVGAATGAGSGMVLIEW